jgi:hypothetical protein
LQRIESERKSRGLETGKKSLEKSSGNATSETTNEPLPKGESNTLASSSKVPKEGDKEKLVIPPEEIQNGN